MSFWRPVLAGSERDAALSVVRDIGEALGRQPIPGRLPTLSSGDAGIALFHAYAHEADDTAGWDELAQARLDAAFDAVAVQPLGPSLFGGFLGVAWAADHIVGAGAESDDTGRDVDEALAQTLAMSPWPRAYDLVGGLVGMGLYALDRISTAPEPERARRCAIQIASHLDALARDEQGGLAWQDPDGIRDLGVAHGIPGVLVLLALFHQRGIAPERSQRLLQGGFAWLAGQRNPDGMASRYGYRGSAPGQRSDSRSAWCYGDVGIAAALLWAARAVPLEGGLEEEALRAAHRACDRPIDDCGAADACLCHGSGGLALLYARLYNATGEERFRERARLWYRKTIDWRRVGTGVAGYRTWARAAGESLTTPKRWMEDAGL